MTNPRPGDDVRSPSEVLGLPEPGPTAAQLAEREALRGPNAADENRDRALDYLTAAARRVDTAPEGAFDVDPGLASLAVTAALVHAVLRLGDEVSDLRRSMP
jgi:hypothetical protein